MKKLVSLALIIFMLTFILPLGVLANNYSGKCGYNVTYDFNPSTGTLTISGSGDMYDYTGVEMPPWYDFCDAIKQINISAGVTSIGKFAFYSCYSLTSISIPNSVTSIGYEAFCDCDSLTSISIPNSVTSIGDGAFYDCDSLTSISIPNSVTSIGDYAFSFCDSLTSISIPNSVTSIGDGAFYWCDSLKSIYYYGDNDGVIATLEEYSDDVTVRIELPINVVLNGVKINFDQPPIMRSGRTLVPIRAISEALGATVEWDGETGTVTANKDGHIIKLTINSEEMKVGNTIKTLDVPARIVNGRTLVPVRAISEAFGCSVGWNESTRTVIIETL